MCRAGAAVTVVQRFPTDARIERDGATYLFVSDGHPPWLSTGIAPRTFCQVITGVPADVVHVNGLIFPKLVDGLRKLMGPAPAIVVQHHGGDFPVRGTGPIGRWRHWQWRKWLAAADAVSFTAAAQAQPWRDAGILGQQRVLEVVEASTTLRTVPRERASAAIGVPGSPLILWVGRLTRNKDPLTVLDGLELALPHLPGAAVVMIFGDSDLLPEVTGRIQSSPVLRPRITLVGEVPHDEMPNYYSAADIFISGSHNEGSGYALIEALSSGVTPVVTDIPPFRAIAGHCGTRFAAGDAAACAAALRAACARDLAAGRAEARAHFERALQWDAIAATTLAAYRELATHPRRAT